MKICIFQPAIPHYRDSFYRAINRHGARRNIHVHVYGSPVDFNGVKSIRRTAGYDASLTLRTCVIGKGRWMLVWYRNWPRNDGNADVVIVNGNPRILNIYFALIRCKFRGTPIIWWGQGWAAGSRGIRSKIRQFLMRPFDGWILYTERERDDYLRLGFEPGRVASLNNGLDVDAIDESIAKWPRNRLQDFQARMDLGSLTWLVFVGRFRPQSGVELLIPALARLPKHIGLLVLGDGPTRKFVEEQTKEFQVESRVRWAGEIFDEELIAPWLLSARLMVYPGNVGLSLIHGFAYGLPAIVHDNQAAHNPEIAALEPGVNGWTYSQDRGAEAMAETIKEALSNSARLSESSTRARATVKHEFNVNRMADRLLDALPRR